MVQETDSVDNGETIDDKPTLWVATFKVEAFVVARDEQEARKVVMRLSHGDLHDNARDSFAVQRDCEMELYDEQRGPLAGWDDDDYPWGSRVYDEQTVGEWLDCDEDD